MGDNYILKGKTPVECEDILEWGQWIETANRRVAFTVVGTFRVSTVFLGLDHNFHDNGPPQLFESMAFSSGGWTDEIMDRYSTWEEAERGHADMVESVREEEWLRVAKMSWWERFLYFGRWARNIWSHRRRNRRW